MKSTKQKILDAALKLFNQDGIVNVRLQHIADEAFVSVGNLAYHYSNKESIVF
ncbi:MAG: TetR/AcrR family transcriptional regulator, partial [Bacteroidota bacterium]